MATSIFFQERPMRKRSDDSVKIVPSDITPYEQYLSRRSLIAGGLGLSAVQSMGGFLGSAFGQSPAALNYVRNAALSVTDAPNSYADITTYNNYYEFGTDKSDPSENSQKFRTQPWSVTVGGEAEVTGTFTLEDMLKPHPLEERVYRLRCDEAMHPLTLMAAGLYGKVLPNQNGAPLRLIVPWKYGFKGIKAIVSIKFTEHATRTTWAGAASNEYGFFANVNPAVDHPRWSQATERHIGSSAFGPRRPTLPFNGYAEQVASLYSGMDLRKYF